MQRRTYVAKIFMGIATNSYSIEICGLYCNKMTASRNENYLSQYRDYIATIEQFVAIQDLYCNKLSIYRDQTQFWQYVQPITTTGEFVVILRSIATKGRCSNIFFC